MIMVLQINYYFSNYIFIDYFKNLSCVIFVVVVLIYNKQGCAKFSTELWFWYIENKGIVVLYQK